MPQYTRLLLVGNSETFGARATHGLTYPQQLEDLLNQRAPWVPTICLNRGISGEKSWEIVNRAVDYLIGDEWIRYCICMMGTNDSYPGAHTPIRDYIRQWERLRRACHVTDTPLLALAIHPIHPIGQPMYDLESQIHIDLMNHAMFDWADQHGVSVVSSYCDAFRSSTDLLADGIHPNNQGNLVIATAVADYLTRGLEPVPQPNGHLVTTPDRLRAVVERS